MKKLWGIDLGGTKIEGVVIASSGEILFRDRIATEAENGYSHLLERISLLLDQMIQAMGVRPEKIGIGTPGVCDPSSGLMKNSNTTCLNGQPLLEDLNSKLQIPVIMANDANCFALAETKSGVVAGSHPDAKVVFGVIMGTGVGGGLVVNGHLVNGLHGIGGEWGHIFLDESGGSCYCGKTGCVETVISGKSLERYHFETFGESISLPQIYEGYQQGDANSSVTINRLLTQFAKGISTVINILDPDVIVLGGGVGNIEALYDEGVERVKRYIFNNELRTRFLKPDLGDSAGVFGAAYLTE